MRSAPGRSRRAAATRADPGNCRRAGEPAPGTAVPPDGGRGPARRRTAARQRSTAAGRTRRPLAGRRVPCDPRRQPRRGDHDPRGGPRSTAGAGRNRRTHAAQLLGAHEEPPGAAGARYSAVLRYGVPHRVLRSVLMSRVVTLTAATALSLGLLAAPAAADVDRNPNAIRLGLNCPHGTFTGTSAGGSALLLDGGGVAVLQGLTTSAGRCFCVRLLAWTDRTGSCAAHTTPRAWDRGQSPSCSSLDTRTTGMRPPPGCTPSPVGHSRAALTGGRADRYRRRVRRGLASVEVTRSLCWSWGWAGSLRGCSPLHCAPGGAAAAVTGP
jgi:hypothetical protein